MCKCIVIEIRNSEWFLLYVGQLGSKSASANSSRIGLNDADHFADVARLNAETGAHAAYGAVRRGHVRIRAEVDVEHGRVCAFDYYLLVGVME